MPELEIGGDQGQPKENDIRHYEHNCWAKDLLEKSNLKPDKADANPLRVCCSNWVDEFLYSINLLMD